MYYIIGILLILSDIFTKHMATKFLKNGESIEILEGILRLNYVENTGAAFGIMKDMRWFFIFVTFVLLIILYVWFRKSFQKGLILRIGMLFVISGALGNLVDRVLFGYVVDFIDFYIINFPVFNMADCFICIGAAALCIHYLFIEKDIKNEQN